MTLEKNGRRNIVQLRFERENENKHTVRFKEVPEDDAPTVLGTIYVQRWFVGGAEELLLTIEKAPK